MYSIGYCAVNKERKSHDIEVVLVENAPFTDGEITDNTETFEAKGQDDEGNGAFDISIDTTATVKATWFPLAGTNRITPPDIRRGEPVIVFKMGDADRYYWVEWKYSDKLRRLETVLYVWSNERKENVKVTHQNSYWFTVSTHDKYIRLHTSKSDGEPFEYDIELNTKEGKFTIMDDVGNYIHLDSEKKLIRMENRDKSFLELNKTIINMESSSEINLKTNKYTLQATSSISMKTSDYSIKTNSYKLNSSTAQITSLVDIKGNTTIHGDTRHEGSTHTTGNAYEASSSGPSNTR